MIEWMYIAASYNALVVDISFVEWMNDYGKDGWELVTCVRSDRSWYCVFKRPKEE